MTVYIKELKQSFKSLCIWTASIGFMLLVCILLFPQMKSEMDSVSSIFANMGGFTAAFGMDKLSFGEIMGFYGVECGNVLGIGGGFFAALTGISALAKEEKEHTAEFLLTHPVSRFSVVTQKLLSILTQIFILNLVCLHNRIYRHSILLRNGRQGIPLLYGILLLLLRINRNTCQILLCRICDCTGKLFSIRSF